MNAQLKLQTPDWLITRCVHCFRLSTLHKYTADERPIIHWNE